MFICKNKQKQVWFVAYGKMTVDYEVLLLWKLLQKLVTFYVETSILNLVISYKVVSSRTELGL